MPRLFWVVLVPVTMAGLGACARRTFPIAGTCTDMPAQPPLGHVSIVRAATVDSILLNSGQGALVLAWRWSSDSAAAPGQNELAQVIVRDSMTRRDTVVSLPGTSGTVSAWGELVARPSSTLLWLHFRVLGGVPLRALVAVRPGYRDTSIAYVQHAATTLCAL